MSTDTVTPGREAPAGAADTGEAKASKRAKKARDAGKRGDGVRASVAPGTTDEAFRAGRAWVADLLHGGDGMGEAAGNAPSWPLA